MDVITLAPRLYHLRFPVGHAYLWESPDGLTLVDTGLPGSAPLVGDAIRALGRDPSELRRIVLTHFHEDHVGSAAALAGPGVEVLAHRADAPFIQGERPGPPPVLADWERPIWDGVQARIKDVPEPDPVRVTRPLDGGDEIDLGGGTTAVAVAAPGHTPGSVALHLPDERVLFTGDTVARGPDGRVILGVFNCDPEQAAATFRDLASLDAEIACFGHGDPARENAAAELRAAAFAS
ncbi:MBL fold metallo-hydrolase [Actinomadura kijaniata]|uniref:Glyoxylase-like metal-dependent hydrolase (Beta-lactamase superfamily II) n=1 Tax=Actinomadura namibiensis TaxID=182080 RepID=A0A7W3LUN8_ACTNM|nr:MBL fold metallo-hydrolase [Actinomadura namibiensis]MBA8954635.1 glyoxylase-like metal-dependent hydrolase (beta-lactamase superfamily II) [Actinomadura namibiensis]